MRLLAAFVALAVTTALMGGSYAAFTSSVANDNNLGSNSTFNPVNTAAPVASGTVAALQTLTVGTQGTWRSNVSISRSYQWQVCTSLIGGCIDIIGATSSSYGLGAVPIGSFFRVVETATNSYGSSSAPSGILG